jgi:hypothetical protein
MQSVKKQVNRRFRKLPTERGVACRNPVTGEWFVRGVDRLAPQKRRACRALVATQRAAYFYPHLPPLPLNGHDVEDMRWNYEQPVLHLWAHYGNSIRSSDYRRHPPFDIYAQAFMASHHAPEFVTRDEKLKKQFPPCPLFRPLDAFLCYQPPEEHERTKLHQRSLAREAAARLQNLTASLSAGRS